MRTLPPGRNEFRPKITATVAGAGQRRPGPGPYGVVVIDVSPGALPVWDPPPRRPRLWPTFAGLTVMTVLVAGVIVVVLAGLRVRYRAGADVCAVADVRPFVPAFGERDPRVPPRPGRDSCVLQVDRAEPLTTAVLRLTVTYRRTAAQALFAYRVYDTPGAVPLPGAGARARVVAEPVPGGCRLTATLLDVNVTMDARLTVQSERADLSCDPHGPAARALATSLRTSRARLA
jgi:hypothetical protein